ncbi:MAG: c-type cytochrome [Nitrospirota bacterium]
MNPLRIFATVFGMIGGLWLLTNGILSLTSLPEPDLAHEESDMLRPRVPQEAQSLVNPIASSTKIIEEGRAIYLGAGNCAICHGKEGRGDGEAGALMNPLPRNLTDSRFQGARKDGEIFWAIKEGVQGRGMFSYVPRMITEEQAWKVVWYIRSLGWDD